MKDFNKFIFERNKNENVLFYEFVDYYFNSDLITDEARYEITLCLNKSNLSDYLINENFFDHLKNRYDKAKTVVKNFSDQAKSSLETIVSAAKTSADFIANLIAKIKHYIENVLNITKNKMVEKLKGDKNFGDKLKEIIAKDKNALLKDVDALGKIVKFYKEQLTNKLVQHIKNSLTSILSGDKQPVVENIEYMRMFNENVDMGHNVIQKLVHGIESLPPFSWLNNLKGLAEKGINYLVEGLSNITEKLGGPKIVIPVISSLLAIAIEYNIKGLIKHGLIEAVAEYSIPFIAIIIKTVGFIATTIAVYEVIRLTTSQHTQDQHVPQTTTNQNKNTTGSPVLSTTPIISGTAVPQTPINSA